MSDGSEFNDKTGDSLYATAPPIEAMRMIASHAAAIADGGVRRWLMVTDVSRSYS